MIMRRVYLAASVLLLLAACGLFIPGSPAYLPSLFGHYSQFKEGHSLGFWVRALDGSDQALRRRAIFALGAIGPPAAEAAPTLARILTADSDAEARHQAALALGKMAPASAAEAPALASALAEDREPTVRMNAALALFELGSQARPAVPALIAALKSPANRTNVGTFPYTIQDMAALALGRATAGTTDGVPALCEALQSARTTAKRRSIANALGQIGGAARDATPALQSLLEDDSPEVQQAAQDALRQIAGE
jgi:HEAT repeat protein